METGVAIIQFAPQEITFFGPGRRWSMIVNAGRRWLIIVFGEFIVHPRGAYYSATNGPTTIITKCFQVLLVLSAKCLPTTMCALQVILSVPRRQ